MRITQIFDKGPGGGIRQHVDSAAQCWRENGDQIQRIRLAYGTTEDNSDITIINQDAFLFRQKQIVDNALNSFKPQIIHLHAGFTTTPNWLINLLKKTAPVVGVFHDVSPVCFQGTRLFMEETLICGRLCGVGCWTSGCVRPDNFSSYPRVIIRMGIRLHLWKQWRSFPALVVPSHYLRDLLLSHGADAKQVILIPHYTTMRGAHDYKDYDCLFLFVGRVSKTKGVFTFLEALENITHMPWRAVFAGDGPDLPALRQKVQEKGLEHRITFLGHCNTETLGRLYSTAHCLVFPSLMPESFGLVGLEALAHGCPVIGFPAGGASDWLIHGRTGLVARQSTVERLAELLYQASSSPKDMLDLGTQGRDFIARFFTKENYIGSMSDLHQRLAG